MFGFVHRYFRGRGGLHDITFCFLRCLLALLCNGFAAGLGRRLEGFGAGIRGLFLSW